MKSFLGLLPLRRHSVALSQGEQPRWLELDAVLVRGIHQRIRVSGSVPGDEVRERCGILLHTVS